MTPINPITPPPGYELLRPEWLRENSTPKGMRCFYESNQQWISSTYPCGSKMKESDIILNVYAAPIGTMSAGEEVQS